MTGSQLTDCLTTCSRNLLVKLIVPQLTNNLSTFYQTQSFTMLQEPATCPCPQPDQSNPCLPSCFLKISFNVFHPSMPGSSQWSFRSGFLNKRYAYFISPCMLHTPHISSLFDFSNNIL